jgi:succinate dehydrogenase hydrophobic anchor subunit
MEDYTHRVAVRRALRWVILLLWIVVFAVAAYLITYS